MTPKTEDAERAGASAAEAARLLDLLAPISGGRVVNHAPADPSDYTLEWPGGTRWNVALGAWATYPSNALVDAALLISWAQAECEREGWVLATVREPGAAAVSIWPDRAAWERDVAASLLGRRHVAGHGTHASVAVASLAALLAARP